MRQEASAAKADVEDLDTTPAVESKSDSDDPLKPTSDIPSRPECPEGHILTYQIQPKPHSCDMCGSGSIGRSVVARCTEVCDYDVCVPCSRSLGVKGGRPGDGAVCDSGHSLSQRRASPGVVCDRCGSSLGLGIGSVKEGIRCAEDCDFDLCIPCGRHVGVGGGRSGDGGVCDVGHKLLYVSGKNARIRCDRCLRVCEPNVGVYSCGCECDFDLCVPCGREVGVKDGPAGAAGVCNAGHKLLPAFRLSTASCDRCYRLCEFRRMCCQEGCDFDLCEPCGRLVGISGEFPVPEVSQAPEECEEAGGRPLEGASGEESSSEAEQAEADVKEEAEKSCDEATDLSKAPVPRVDDVVVGQSSVEAPSRRAFKVNLPGGFVIRGPPGSRIIVEDSNDDLRVTLLKAPIAPSP